MLPFRRTSVGVAGLALLILLTPRPARGHALGAECQVVGQQVRVEAYYEDDTPAVRARVTVTDPAGKAVAEGVTDDQGRWTFPVPAAGKYRVVVDAGGGHRTVVAVTIPAAQPAGAAPARVATAACTCCETADPVGDTPQVVSAGPRRAEFTRVPWLKLGAGLGVIGLAGLAGWTIARRQGWGASQSTS